MVGTVTAPFAQHLHETVIFHYRALGAGGGHQGVLTSGTRNKHCLPHPVVPACSEVDLPRQCGRAFAVRLPAGEYEIYRLEVRGRHALRDLSTARFRVETGQVNDLGNLDVAFGGAMVRSTRGNILGADITVRDRFEPDVVLLGNRFAALRDISIKKQLLPAQAWRWRVPYEPYAWGDCGAAKVSCALPNDSSASLDQGLDAGLFRRRIAAPSGV